MDRPKSSLLITEKREVTGGGPKHSRESARHSGGGSLVSIAGRSSCLLPVALHRPQSVQDTPESSPRLGRRSSISDRQMTMVTPPMQCTMHTRLPENTREIIDGRTHRPKTDPCSGTPECDRSEERDPRTTTALSSEWWPTSSAGVRNAKSEDSHETETQAACSHV